MKINDKVVYIRFSIHVYLNESKVLFLLTVTTSSIPLLLTSYILSAELAPGWTLLPWHRDTEVDDDLKSFRFPLFQKWCP